MEETMHKIISLSNVSICRNTFIQVLIAVLILLLGGMFQAGCSPVDSQPVEPGETDINLLPEIQVESSSGTASLTIPRENLPEGTDPGSITLEALPVSDFPGSSSDPEPLMAFSLEPSGLAFAEPVYLTVQIPVEGSIQVFDVLHLSEGGEMDYLAVNDFELNEDSTIITARIPLSHFSKLAIYRGLFFNSQLLVPETVYTGEPFPVQLKITRVRDQFTRIGPSLEHTWYFVGDDWFLEGAYDNGPGLSPGSVRAPEGLLRVNEKDFLLPIDLTCVVENPDPGLPLQIEYTGWLKYQTELEVKGGMDVRTPIDQNQKFVLTTAVSCFRRPASEPPPEPFQTETDPENDPVCCQYCEPVSGVLPGGVDIVEVRVTKYEEHPDVSACAYVFEIKVREQPTSQVYAAVSLFNPDLPQAPGSADHCLERGSNRTFSLDIDDDGIVTFQTRGVSATGEGTGKWIDLEDYGGSGSFEGRVFTFVIPCREFASATTWMAWTTDGEACDEIGY
jgi:hypothetical protein